MFDKVRLNYAVATGALPGSSEPGACVDLMGVRAESLDILSRSFSSNLPWRPELGWSIGDQRVFLARASIKVRHTRALAQACERGWHLDAQGKKQQSAKLRQLIAIQQVKWIEANVQSGDTTRDVPVVLVSNALYPHQIYIGLRKHPDLAGCPIVIRLNDTGPSANHGRTRIATLCLYPEMLACPKTRLAFVNVLLSPQSFEDFHKHWDSLTRLTSHEVPACCYPHAPKPPRPGSKNCTLKNHNLALAADVLHETANQLGPNLVIGRQRWRSLKIADRRQARLLVMMTPSKTNINAKVRCSGLSALTVLGLSLQGASLAASLIRYAASDADKLIVQHTRSPMPLPDDLLGKWQRWLQKCDNMTELNKLEKALILAQNEQPTLQVEIDKLLFEVKIQKDIAAHKAGRIQSSQLEYTQRLQKNNAWINWPAYRLNINLKLRLIVGKEQSRVRILLNNAVCDLIRARATLTNVESITADISRSLGMLLGVTLEGVTTTAIEKSSVWRGMHDFTCVQEHELLRLTLAGSTYWLSSVMLGVGTGGRVHLGVSDTNLHEVVVVKLFSANTADPVREAELALYSGGKLAPLALGYNQTTQECALVMPLGRATGHELVTHFSRCRTPSSAWVYNILLGAADHLANMHAQKIIHGDCKLGNLMLGPASDTKAHESINLIDFGFACHLGWPNWSDGKSNVDTEPLPPGVTPEQVGEDGVSFTADVWRLGLTILHMLGGDTRAWLLYPDKHVHPETFDDPSDWQAVSDRYKAFQRVRRNPFASRLPHVDSEDWDLWQYVWQAVGCLAWPLNRLLYAMLEPDPMIRPAASLISAILGSVRLHPNLEQLLAQDFSTLPMSKIQKTSREQLAKSLSLFHPADITEIFSLSPIMMPSFQEKIVNQVANTPADKRTIFQITCNMIERGAFKDLQMLAQSPCFNLHQEWDGQDLLCVSVKYRRKNIVAWLLSQEITSHLNQAIHDVVDSFMVGHCSTSEQSTLCDILKCLLEKDPTLPYCNGVEGMPMPVLRALQNDVSDCYLPMLGKRIPSTARGELKNVAQLSPGACAALGAALSKPAPKSQKQQFGHTRLSIPEQPSAAQIAAFLKQLSAQVDAMEAQHSDALHKMVEETGDRMRCVLNCAVASLRVQDQQRVEADLVSNESSYDAPETTGLDDRLIQPDLDVWSSLNTEQKALVDNVVRYLEKYAQDDVIPAARIRPYVLEHECGLPQAVASDLCVFLGMVRGDSLADVLETARMLAAKLLLRCLSAPA